MPRNDSAALDWQLTFDDMQVGAAHSTRQHSQKHLTVFRLWSRNLGNPKRPFRNFLR
jgi:hypothetical protein